MKDQLTMGGVFTFKVFENQTDFELDKAKHTVEFHNKMTNEGLAVISGLVGNTGSQTAFTYIAVGSSNTAVSASHTALQAEISTNGLSRASATVSRKTTTQTNDTLVLAKVFTVTGSSTVEEVGVFNASSSGTMLARALTGSISVVNGNVLSATYNWVVVGN
jgi:hypothetical protein